MLDAASAVALAEAAAGSHMLGGRGHSAPADALLTEAREAAERGERVAVIAKVSALASARESMKKTAQARLGIVAHAMAGLGSEDLAALLDVGWGILCAAGPEDSFDLTLIARRAAEDSGVPFVVVHAIGQVGQGTGKVVAMVSLPVEKACNEFVGVASRLKPRSDPGHPSLAPVSERSFAERVPFALGSAFREYSAISGRRHDMVDRVPLGEAPIMLVGLGPVGDALTSATGELRARGYDVGAVHVTSLRPFPGARLVKSLTRVLAVTVLESSDEPFSNGGVLARELKSAFADALTWAPGFPGIGSIPKLFVGVTGPWFDVDDLAAVCDNMLADERGKRSFSFADTDHSIPRQARRKDADPGSLAVRWVLDDVAVAEACLAVTASSLAKALGIRTQGIVVSRDSVVTVDVFATRDHARGAMARRAPRLVLATDQRVESSESAPALGLGGVLGVVSDHGEAVSALSDGVRAILRERRARTISLAIGTSGVDATFAVAATCAGSALAAASRGPASVDSGVVMRVVAEVLAEHGITDPIPLAERARRAFETTVGAFDAAARVESGSFAVR
ncbi:MAG: hypothetical protein FWD69_08525 [Polyangiaceae bacterium]|nr:hypothetical protein [Polyangiaceae bacterium]